MQTNITSMEIAEDKQRTIEGIIEKNSGIENVLAETLSLLLAMEARLVGVREDSPLTEESPNPTSHLPMLQQQQERMESLSHQILSMVNILRSHI